MYSGADILGRPPVPECSFGIGGWENSVYKRMKSIKGKQVYVYSQDNSYGTILGPSHFSP